MTSYNGRFLRLAWVLAFVLCLIMGWGVPALIVLVVGGTVWAWDCLRTK